MKVEGILLFCLFNAWKNPFVISRIFMTSTLLFILVLLKIIVTKVLIKFSLAKRLLQADLIEGGYSLTGLIFIYAIKLRIIWIYPGKCFQFECTILTLTLLTLVTHSLIKAKNAPLLWLILPSHYLFYITRLSKAKLALYWV